MSYKLIIELLKKNVTQMVKQIVVIVCVKLFQAVFVLIILLVINNQLKLQLTDLYALIKSLQHTFPYYQPQQIFLRIMLFLCMNWLV